MLGSVGVKMKQHRRHVAMPIRGPPHPHPPFPHPRGRALPLGPVSRWWHMSPLEKVMFVLFVSSIASTLLAILWVVWVITNVPVCGTSLDSAAFSISSDFNVDVRVLTGNSCPGYDWTDQSTPALAGDISFTKKVPLYPTLCTSPTYLDGSDGSDDIEGEIGRALNGVSILSPLDDKGRDAVEYEHDTFDGCGGHVTPVWNYFINNVLSLLRPGGSYHYHAMPGDTDAYDHSDSQNSDFQLCSSVTEWYTEVTSRRRLASNHSKDSTGRLASRSPRGSTAMVIENLDDSVFEDHSPMVGFLADGIPLTGPFGTGGGLPDDLDTCGGHASDLSFYHYHISSEYPYTVRCLWGRTAGDLNPDLNSKSTCSESDTQYDYTDLENLSLTYGGSGENKRTLLPCVGWLVISLTLLLFSWMYHWEREQARIQSLPPGYHQRQDRLAAEAELEKQAGAGDGDSAKLECDEQSPLLVKAQQDTTTRSVEYRSID